jgi:hypothetical protein
MMQLAVCCLAAFLVGFGSALYGVGRWLDKARPEPGPKHGDIVPCPGLPKCDVGYPHAHTIEVVEYIDDVIEGAQS